MGPQRLVIFVKAPRVGEVKTRLAKSIGAEAACDAYRLLVETLLEKFPATSPYGLSAQQSAIGNRQSAIQRVELRFTPDDALAEVQPWLRAGWRARPQCEGDLGERLRRACTEHFADGCGRLVIIGSDCPEVTVEDIEAAWAALTPNPLTRPSGTVSPTGREGWGEGELSRNSAPSDLILGPATDGGYWLIGLRTPQPKLFERIQWSTPTVFADTMARAKQLSLRVSLLRELSDVDTAEDWERFLRCADPMGSGSARVPSRACGIVGVPPTTS